MAERSGDESTTPTAPLGDSGTSTVDVAAAVRSELICFLQNKSTIMPFDQVVKICVDFYNREEIMSARQLLDRYLPSRLPRRQGPGASCATVEDLLKKSALNPQLNVPTCYAVAMDRLPPVDAAHCDVSAILVELQALRAEVRASAKLWDDVSNLTAELLQVRAEVSDLQLKCSGSTLSEDQWHHSFRGLLQVQCHYHLQILTGRPLNHLLHMFRK